jgi:hypothetical protein
MLSVSKKLFSFIETREERSEPKKMTQKVLFLLFTISICKLMIKSRQERKVDEIESVDKNCPRNSPCMSHSSCPFAMEQFQQLSKLDSKEYVELARNIKLQVCNKKEKAVCCQPEPEEGEDCVWNGKGYANGAQIQDLQSWWFEVRCGKGRRMVQGRQWGEVTRDRRFRGS